MSHRFQPEWVAGNLFIRPNELTEKGDVVHGHKHNFDHLTIVRRGRVHVHAVLPNGSVLDREFDAVGRSHFVVYAHVEHEITALEDHTEFWCVYSHREPQGQITQQYTGWEKAYC